MRVKIYSIKYPYKQKTKMKCNNYPVQKTTDKGQILKRTDRKLHKNKSEINELEN